MAGKLVSTLLLLVGLTSCWTVKLTGAGPTAKKNSATKSIDFLMPNVQPKVKDSYLCHAMKASDNPEYLVGFQPHADMTKAHHILIFGCTDPGSDESVWDCGEMHSSAQDFQQASVCKEGQEQTIIYAWAMDAPELRLPPNVGFKVGGKTNINYLILQVHYKDVTSFLPPSNEKDASGVTLITTNQRQPKRAGVYLMATEGEIPPHSTTYMETACSYNEPFTMHPFAYRTHAHTHGQVTAGYRIRNGEWVEIGRKSPQKPQMFYNVTHPGMTVENGDILAARCTMVNDEDRTVKIGATSNDEMCNFYIMYYIDGDMTPREHYCVTPGPPHWNWNDFQGLDSALAPPSASMVPGTDKLLEATERMFDQVEEAMGQHQENSYRDLDLLSQLLEDERDGVGDVLPYEDYLINDPESLQQLLERERELELRYDEDARENYIDEA